MDSKNKKAIQDAIEWYLNTSRLGIIKQMQEKGMWATGRTASQIVVRVKATEGEMVGPAHLNTLIHGRPPGKLPPIQEIMKWIAVRGLDLNPWAVAKKMAERGSAIWRRVRPGLDVQSELNNNKKEFMRRTGQAYMTEIADDIKKAKKQLKK